MSHFINSEQRIQSKCILSIPSKQIVTPKYRQLLRQSISVSKTAQIQCKKQEMIIKHLCLKLTQKQLQKVRAQNQKNLKKQFDRIKKNLRCSAYKQNCQSQVIKCFEGRTKVQDLSSLLKTQDQTIDIGMKYQNKISNKLNTIRQISQIQDNKYKYRYWLNSLNNSPVKSPNYSKMNYILEKVSKKRQLSQIFNNRLYKQKQKQNQNLQIKKRNQLQTNLFKFTRNSHKNISRTSSVISQILHTDYSPKSKCPAFKKRYY